MWLRIVFSLLISLSLFLLQQFLAPNLLMINVFAVLVIFLSLKQLPNRIWYVFFSGLLLDIAYGSWGVNLLSLFLLYYLFNLFTGQISVFSYWARILLIMGGLLVYLLLNLVLTQILDVIFNSFEHYSFALSPADILNYLITNSLLAILLLLIFRKKSRELSYETF